MPQSAAHGDKPMTPKTDFSMTDDLSMTAKTDLSMKALQGDPQCFTLGDFVKDAREAGRQKGQKKGMGGKKGLKEGANRFAVLGDEACGESICAAKAAIRTTSSTDLAKKIRSEKVREEAKLEVKKGQSSKMAVRPEVPEEDLVCHICTVSSQAPWMPAGTGEITVDSAAEESVCPKKWGEAYPMQKPAKWFKLDS